MKRTWIIGAGGTTRHFLPVFLRSIICDKDSLLIDGEALEYQYLDQYSFEPQHVGMNKAKAVLLSQNFKKIREFRYIDKYLTEETLETLLKEEKSPDLIFCFANNNPARKIALEAADKSACPILLTSSHMFESEAYIYYPQWKDGPRDPRLYSPNILEPHDPNDPAHPWTFETSDNYPPQLSSTAMITASFALRLYTTWISIMKIHNAREMAEQEWDVLKHMTFRPSTSQYETYSVSAVTAREYLPTEMRENFVDGAEDLRPLINEH